MTRRATSQRGSLRAAGRWRGHSSRLGLALSLSAALPLAACSRTAGPAASAANAEQEAPLPRDVVERAAVSFTVRSNTGRQDESSLRQLLSTRRVVCVGERHPDPVHHYVQWQVIREMAKLASQAGESFAVGFEMFDRSQQAELDRFAEKRVTEEAFLRDSGYEERWGFDFNLYRPLLEEGRGVGAKLLGLNAPRHWTRQVAQLGLDRIPSELGTQFPELVLDDPRHREFFAAAMQSHPGHSAQTHAATGDAASSASSQEHDSGAVSQAPPREARAREADAGGPALSPEDHTHQPHHGQVAETLPNDTSHAPVGNANSAAEAGNSPARSAPEAAPMFDHGLETYYQAQVLWDETMAETAAQWLTESPGGRRLVIIAGNGHCHESAIPNRIQRRTGIPVSSARPIRESELHQQHVPVLEHFDMLLVIDDQTQTAGSE